MTPSAAVEEIRERVRKFKEQYSPGPDWEPFNQMYQDCATLLRAYEEEVKWTASYREAMEKVTDSLRTQLAQAEARMQELESCLEPGKASGMAAGLFALARELGQSPFSSQAPGGFIKDRVAALEEGIRERAEQIAARVDQFRELARNLNVGPFIESIGFVAELLNHNATLLRAYEAVERERDMYRSMVPGLEPR